MRRLLNIILFLACFASSQASTGPGPGATAEPGPTAGPCSKVPTGPGPGATTVALHSNTPVNAGTARFRFKNLIAGMERKDSILIIFDRYDHTGAGVIHQVFAADGDQSITVPGIAPGKYYVTLQCIGLHRDRLEKIVTIRSHRSETVRICLIPSEAYSKNKVVIPAFHPDLSDLAVVRFK